MSYLASTYVALDVEPRFAAAELGRISSFKLFLTRKLDTELILEVDIFLPFLLFKWLISFKENKILLNS